MPTFDLSGTAFTAWYNQPLGHELTLLETEQLDSTVATLPVCHTLQLGPFIKLLKSKKAFRFKQCIYTSPDLPSTLGTVYAQSVYTHLPFRDHSFELVILPHILEFETATLPILEECWRVLTPNGYLVILGFNPWSLWGICRLFASRWTATPWNGHFHSAEKLQRQLKRLKAHIILTKNFFYRPPINNENFLTRTRWLEKVLRLLLPTNGGAYLIMVQKRVTPLTLLKPRWRWQTLLADDKSYSASTVGHTKNG